MIVGKDSFNELGIDANLNFEELFVYLGSLNTQKNQTRKNISPLFWSVFRSQNWGVGYEYEKL